MILKRWDATEGAAPAIEVRLERIIHEIKIHEETRKYSRNIAPRGNVFAASAKKIKCYACGKLGHMAKDCKNTDNEGDHKKNTPKNKRIALLAKNKEKMKGIFIDSGASDHMFWDRKLFDEYKTIDGEIIAANNSSLKISGKGSLRISTIVEGEDFDVTLKDVLHVPELFVNLLSVKQLVKNGADVNFRRNLCEISYNGDIIGIGLEKNSLFRLEEKERFGFLTIKQSNAIKLHHRPGHIGMERLKKALNDEMFKDFDASGIQIKDPELSCTG